MKRKMTEREANIRDIQCGAIPIGPYKGSSIKRQYECTTCGNLYMTTPNQIRCRGKLRCNNCRKTIDDAKDILRPLNLDIDENSYISFTKKSTIICSCGKRFKSTITSIKSQNISSCGHCDDPSMGDKYGKLTIIKVINGKKRGCKVVCKCDCGNIIKQHNFNHIRIGLKRSCGYCNLPNIGERFGKLTVVGINLLPGGSCQIRTQCDCGREYIPSKWYKVSSGNTRSCGHCNDPGIGDKFGMLTIIDVKPSSRIGCQVKAQCECGRIIGPFPMSVINRTDKQGQISCGHCNDPNIGDKKGNLTVEEKKENNTGDGGGGCSIRCRCDCGKLTVWKAGCYFYNSTWHSCGNCKLYRNGIATSFSALKVHDMVEEIVGHLCEHNYKIDGKCFDIVDLKNKIVIEYDEYYWHRTVQDTSKKERADTRLALRNNFKMLRVRAKEDLPTKEQLKKAINNHFEHGAKQHTITTPGWKNASIK